MSKLKCPCCGLVDYTGDVVHYNADQTSIECKVCGYEAKAVEYKVCMYLQFVSGDDPESYYPGEDKLWFEILLDRYFNRVFSNTIDCNGFELPLSFMNLSTQEREAARDELMGRAVENIAEMLERNHIEQYSFDNEGGLIDLTRIESQED